MSAFEMYVTEDNKPGNNARAVGFRRDVPPTRLFPVVCVLEQGSNFVARAIDYLEQDGYSVRTLAASPDLVQRLKQLTPTLVLVEATALESAIDLCRAIRKAPFLNWTPVVLLAEDPSLEKRIHGLESGADEYIAQSSSREILARVRALIRRFMRHAPSYRFPFAGTSLQSSWFLVSPSVRVGDIEIDPGAMTIVVRDRVIEATKLEVRMLYYLLLNHGRVFTRDQLLNAVWDSEFVESRSVDACIRRIRSKIEPNPVHPTYLKTVRGAGYCFRAPTA